MAKICGLSLVFCCTASTVACLAGIGQALGWPLSGQNFSFGLAVGAILGLVTSVMVGTIALAARESSRITIIVAGAVLTAAIGGFLFSIWCAGVASV